MSKPRMTIKCTPFHPPKPASVRMDNQKGTHAPVGPTTLRSKKAKKGKNAVRFPDQMRSKKGDNAVVVGKAEE